MSKKHKFKDKKKLFSRKHLRSWLFRLGLIGVGVAAGVLAKPSLIQDPVKRTQVEDMREQILEANDIGQEKALQVLGESAEVAKTTLKKASEVTGEITHTDPQQLVETTVTNLKEEVKSLPEKEVKRIKLEFCQDVIKEIEITCENK